MPVVIHFIFPNAVPQEVQEKNLTKDEQSKAARFHFPKDAIHWSACRAGLRQLLGREIGLPPHEVPLVYKEFGKPILAAPFQNVHFNLSHSANLAVVAISHNCPVGIDLESNDRAHELLECEKSFCHPTEIGHLAKFPEDRARQLLRIWTAKEATLKALGTGLSHPPEAVVVNFHLDPPTAESTMPLEGIENQRLRQLTHPYLENFTAFLATSRALSISYG